MSESIPMAPAPSKASALVKYMQAKQGAFAAVASKHLTAERMVRIVGALLSRQPALAECTPISVLTSVMAATQLGLDPTGIGGQGYLVPFKRSEKRGDKWIKIPEAQFIPGYRGLMEIAYRTGTVELVQPYAVFEGDLFQISLGSEPKIEHKPTGTLRVIEKLTHVYCVATFKTGRTAFRVLTRAELEVIKAAALEKTPEWNRAKSAWNTHTIPMMLKSAVRRMCNWLPQTPDLSLGVALSDADESGEGIDTALVAAQLGADLDQLGGKQALEEGATVSDTQDVGGEQASQGEPVASSRTESVVRRVTKPKPERQVVAVQEPEVEVADESPVDDQTPPPPQKSVPKVAASTPKPVDDVYSKLIAEKAMTGRFKALTTRFNDVGKFESVDKSTDAVFSFLGDLSINVPDIKQDVVWEKVVKIVSSPEWSP